MSDGSAQSSAPASSAGTASFDRTAGAQRWGEGGPEREKSRSLKPLMRLMPYIKRQQTTAVLAIIFLFVAAAMGAENTTFERDGEVSIGLTYMTGALVKLGQRLAGAIMGGPKLAWAPYLMLWLGLAGGAVAGALAWPVFGLAGLWAGVAGALVLAGAAFLVVCSEAA